MIRWEKADSRVDSLALTLSKYARETLDARTKAMQYDEQGRVTGDPVELLMTELEKAARQRARAKTWNRLADAISYGIDSPDDTPLKALMRLQSAMTDLWKDSQGGDTWSGRLRNDVARIEREETHEILSDLRYTVERAIYELLEVTV